MAGIVFCVKDGSVKNYCKNVFEKDIAEGEAERKRIISHVVSYVWEPYATKGAIPAGGRPRHTELYASDKYGAHTVCRRTIHAICVGIMHDEYVLKGTLIELLQTSIQHIRREF